MRKPTLVAEQKRIEGLSKGLVVLRSLNDGDQVTVVEISRRTGIPRPTVYRILKTLIDDGYVAKQENGKVYRLTEDVRALGAGYNDGARVANLAEALVAQLSKQVKWPMEVTTYDGDAMLVRVSTHRSSPWSLVYDTPDYRGRPGYRARILTSASGHCFLAFCSDAKRAGALELLQSAQSSEDDSVHNIPDVDVIISQTRKQGYGLRVGGLTPETGTVAVPIMYEGEPAACINLHYVLSAISLEDVAKQFVTPMKELAKEIEVLLTEQDRDARMREIRPQTRSKMYTQRDS